MTPQMMFFLNANTTNFDNAFMSRLSHRIMWKPQRGDWARLKASINKNKSMDSPEILQMIFLTRLAAWLPLLKQTGHVPTPPQDLTSTLDLLLDSMKEHGCIVLVEPQRFVGRLQNDAVNSHAALRAVCEALAETELPLAELASQQWKKTTAEILALAVRKWHVTLQDVVYAISFERDSIGNETLLLIVSLARLRLMQAPALAVADHQNRVWVEEECCNLRVADTLKASILEQLHVDILPNDLKTLSDHLLKRPRRHGTGKLVTRREKTYGFDLALLQRALTPLERCIVDYFMESEFHVRKPPPSSDQPHRRRAAPFARMTFETATRARLPGVEVACRVHTLYRRCPKHLWVGVSSSFSLLEQVPKEFVEGADRIRVDRAAFQKIPDVTPAHKMLRKMILGMPVTVAMTAQNTQKLRELDAAPLSDPYWRLFDADHAVVAPGRVLESSLEWPTALHLSDNAVVFYTQDLQDYAQAKGHLFEPQDLIKALHLMRAINALEPHLSMAELDHGSLTLDGFRVLHGHYIGALGQALQNIKNLTEEPVTLTSLWRPRYGANTFRTMYYNPNTGQEVPFVAECVGNTERFVPFSAASSRQLAEAMLSEH